MPHGLVRALGLFLVLLTGAQPVVRAGECPAPAPVQAEDHGSHTPGHLPSPQHQHSLPCTATAVAGCLVMSGCSQVNPGLPAPASSPLDLLQGGAFQAAGISYATRAITPDSPPPRL